jgi:serine O-acetyltransferase
MDVTSAIIVQLRAALWECCPFEFIHKLDRTTLLSDVALELTEDVEAFTSKDPAANNDPFRIIQSYTSFKAVLHYRLAHKINSHFYCNVNLKPDFLLYASIISSRGKLLSGADLNPACRIGKRFILDHGIGTVFGETAEIGDDCYVLGGVTLGARGISNNSTGKRHPTIGNRVQIGAFACVFGPVTIGDDVFIGPQCTVTNNVASHCKVILRTSTQVIFHGNDNNLRVLPDTWSQG